MENLFKLLPGLLKSFPDSPEVREAVVFAVWKKAAGESLRAHAVPTAIKNDRLFISVRDKIWKRNLESMAPELLYRLNRLLESGKIKYLDFQIDEEVFGRVTENRHSADRTIDRSTDYSLPADLVEKAESIKDKKLRQNFLDSAAVYLQMKDARKGK